MPEVKVVVEMTLEQARANIAALDLYSRLSMGQLHEITTLLQTGELKVANPHFERDTQNKHASIDQIRAVDDLVTQMKRTLGFTSGSSHSIGSKSVSMTAHRTWELKKVMDKTLAMHNNPNPDFRGVNYDGLILRYTQDKAPVCQVIEA